MKKALSLLLTLAVVMTAAVIPVGAESSDKVTSIIENMTTEQKVTQMLMPTFRYWYDDGVEQINSEIEAVIKKYGFAGVILFAQNCKTTEGTVRLLDDMQRANASVNGRPALLTAVDQEGGNVARLGMGCSMSGNMSLGAIGDTSVTEQASSIIGSELSAIGFNVDFAPVCDVNNNPENPVIGIRSFSDDPQTVAEQSSAFLKGLQSNGVAASLKHFPGHGNTSSDSHTGLPCVLKTYDELKECELVPFQRCIDAGTEMIMTAHIQFPNIETETYISKQTGESIYLPATLSKTIINDILRGDMGYDGVVVTDAMEMDAISEHFGRYDAARLAINAGVDILLIPTGTKTTPQLEDFELYIAQLVKMVEEGTISVDNVNKSVERILKLKEKLGLLNGYTAPDVNTAVSEAKTIVGSAEHHTSEIEIAKKAITLVKNDDTLPIRTSKKTVILTAYENELLSADYAVELLRSDSLLENVDNVTVCCYYGKTIAEVNSMISDADNVIIITEMYSARALNPNADSGATFKLVDQIIENAHTNNAKATILSCYLPYDAARFQSADAILLAWGAKGMSEDPRIKDGDLETYGPNIPAGIYMAFTDKQNISGTLPVNIPQLNDDYTYGTKALYPRGFGLIYSLNDRLCGDLDIDGQITANDALTILRKSVGQEKLTPEQKILADVDGDGEITANDALAVLRYSVGMADEDSPINKPIAA